MTEKQTYLVSDLANELGVPRTTVNDWLKRYDRYLPSEMSGRRRIYTAAALEVLKSVNKMRNDGLSAAKIESEREKKFAIRPDEVPEPELKSAPDEGKDIAAAGNDGTPSLPALRREEFDRFIGTVEEFSRMEKNRRRHALYVWLVILLTAVFSVAAAWFMTQLVKLQAANNSRLARIQIENAEARNAQIKAEKDGKKALENQSREISELRKSMASTRAAEENARKAERAGTLRAMEDMQKLIKSVKAEQNSLKQELENRFVRELKAKDNIIKVQQKEKDAAGRKLRERERELQELRQQIETLRNDLKKMEKSAAEKKNAPEQQRPGTGKKAVSDRETKAVETAEQTPEKAAE